MNINKNKLSLAIVASLTCSTAAIAEEASKSEAKKQSIEVIEVTARKKIESIQTVPMSVNAVTGEHIEDMGVNDITDLAKFIPGLEQPKLAGSSRLSLRGVSSGDNASFEQSVGTYVDGIYRGRMNQQRAGFFDMERVEVLKGPQVTLYGNSSIGGAISMVTKRPELDSEITGNVKLRYGVEFEQTEIIGGVNIPLGDDFAIRLAGKYRDKSKGGVLNQYSNEYETQEKDDAYRVGAYWEPSSSLSFYLRYEQGNFETIGHNLAAMMHLNADSTPKEDSPFIALGMGGDTLNIGNGAPFINGRDGNRTETEETMLEVVYDISDSMTLTSITGFSSYDYSITVDVDIMPTPVIDTRRDETYEQLSQELRLAINVNDKLDVLVGAYYQEDDFVHQYYRDFNSPDVLALIGLGGFAPFFEPMSVINELDQTTKQTSVFAQVDYAFTDKLSATFGMRYSDMDKTATQSALTADIEHNLGFGAVIPAPVPLVGGFPNYLAFYSVVLGGSAHIYDDLARAEDHTMFQASLRYQLSDDTMIYGTWGNGAKAGGFDALFEGTNPDDVQFEDESVNAFEVGFKQDWDDVRLNVAAFYGKYDDLQVSVFNGTVGFNVGNAATSIQQGVDVELTWVATDNLLISANAEYLDFTYDEFDDAACSFSEDPLGELSSCDWSGRELPWVPKFKMVINAEHIFELTDSLELTNMLSVSYKTEHSFSSDNDPLLMQDAYALVDYRATLMSMDSDWHVALTVSNLLDEDYETYASKIPLNQGAFAHVLSEGREITLEVGYQF